jgi:hypothetical protein
VPKVKKAVETKGKPRPKRVLVEKQAFDRVLGKLIHTSPKPHKTEKS